MHHRVAPPPDEIQIPRRAITPHRIERIDQSISDCAGRPEYRKPKEHAENSVVAVSSTDSMAAPATRVELISAVVAAHHHADPSLRHPKVVAL